jgi:ABC-2 type transport system ATP-binding protein
MTTASLSAAIQTHELSKGYRTTVALHPLTLSVPRGAVFALVGHNGAGKTTLIKLLMNMLEPSSGSATILGRTTTTLTGKDFTSIGYASENQELPDWMTVGQFLKYLRPFYPTWDDAALVKQFDLPLDRKLKNLSRGMLMKAALASILAFNPALILLDEPFSGLDPLVRDELIEALRPSSLASSEQTVGVHRPTILISSHDLAEVESFATHIGFLHKGQLLFSEEMSTLMARFREVTVSLAPPPPPLGEVAPEPVKPVPTTVPDSWLLFEQTPIAARFVHMHADTESVAGQVAATLPNVANVHVEPMTLRAIFLALAKSGRAPAAL